MHIKIYRRINNKQQGYVLLEAIIILMVVASICMLLNKVVINNYLKSSVVYTRDDIKTLSKVEEKELLNAITFFNEDRTKVKYISPNLNGEIKKITIDINGTSGWLIKERSSNGKSYIQLECNEIIKNEIKLINIVPKFYETDYILQ